MRLRSTPPQVDGHRALQSSYMFQGLEHTAIASPDPAGLAQWYVDTLGFHINFKYDQFFFVKAPNGSMLEIIPSEGERGSNSPKDPGIRHLAIAIDDFDAAYEQLKKAGVQFLGEPYNNQGNRLVFFADRDGNILHLIHREKPLP
jgi:catechol 2,3-dioxygenase-like lactoylglutathione lyase family enzyme